MLDGVTINQLRTFVAVCDEGSFSAAARRLRRAQSAVSHAVAALEAALLVELFERDARRTALTAAGRSLLPDALARKAIEKAAVDRLAALEAAISAVRRGGTVSIVGVYGPTFNAVPIGNAVNKGLTLRMNQASVKRHLPRLMEHIKAGRVEPHKIITHRIPLEEAADAYHLFSSKLDNCIKPVLIPPGVTV